MPAFAATKLRRSMLTDDQVNAIAGGIRTRWAKPAALLSGGVPPYAAKVPGDPKRGAAVYGIYCSSCHGPDGHGGGAMQGFHRGWRLSYTRERPSTFVPTMIVGRPDIECSGLARQPARQAHVTRRCV